MFGRKKIRLSNGDLRFVLPDGKNWDCDATIIKITCEILQRKHKLPTVNHRIEATDEFLVELAGELQQLGCDDCNPSLARQIWIATAERFIKMDREFKKQLRKL
jgi:hypothetical protein